MPLRPFGLRNNMRVDLNIYNWLNGSATQSNKYVQVARIFAGKFPGWLCFLTDCKVALKYNEPWGHFCLEDLYMFSYLLMMRRYVYSIRQSTCSGINHSASKFLPFSHHNSFSLLQCVWWISNVYLSSRWSNCIGSKRNSGVNKESKHGSLTAQRLCANWLLVK